MHLRARLPATCRFTWMSLRATAAMLASLDPDLLAKMVGDVVVRRENWTFAFPIVTCLLISMALSLLFWIVHVFRR